MCVQVSLPPTGQPVVDAIPQSRPRARPKAKLKHMASTSCAVGPRLKSDMTCCASAQFRARQSRRSHARCGGA
eukprot:5221762-Pleurochrysis_carterae.AAC.2